MKLYPAIDLRGGQAVRLYQGDYDQMTVYNADPVAQAKAFMTAGAWCATATACWSRMSSAPWWTSRSSA